MPKKAKTKQGSTSGEQAKKNEVPAIVQEQRDYVTAGEHLNYNTTTASSSWTYLTSGGENHWDQTAWEKQFSVSCSACPAADRTEDDLIFDLKGIDASVANALRRILLEEVPTMAIEHVFIINNTSILPDEMLAHRLGLVPIKADPAFFSGKSATEQAHEYNVLVFKLKASCHRQGSGLVDDNVYSEQLEWLPGGSELSEESNCNFQKSQQDLLPEGAAPVHDKILIAKMRAGQQIEVECHATKGLGAEHAKWSPVATAWYRLLPEVVVEDVRGKDAQELAEQLPGLISLEGSERVARAGNARDYPHLLEKVRRYAADDRWSKRVRLRKLKTHFIFTIQSAGQLRPENVFCTALDTLSHKCDALLETLA